MNPTRTDAVLQVYEDRQRAVLMCKYRDVLHRQTERTYENEKKEAGLAVLNAAIKTLRVEVEARVTRLSDLETSLEDARIRLAERQRFLRIYPPVRVKYRERDDRQVKLVKDIAHFNQISNLYCGKIRTANVMVDRLEAHIYNLNKKSASLEERIRQLNWIVELRDAKREADLRKKNFGRRLQQLADQERTWVEKLAVVADKAQHWETGLDNLSSRADDLDVKIVQIQQRRRQMETELELARTKVQVRRSMEQHMLE